MAEDKVSQSSSNRDEPEHFADEVDEALEAMWRGDAGGMDRIVDGEDATSTGPGIGGLLERVAGDRLDSDPGRGPGAKIGNFTIKSMIGRGGMGTVYLAIQEHPRRTVALKVMKRGLASRSALRRFEHESQILARLRHPNIAQVYEAGTHQEDEGRGILGAGAGAEVPGVPYFALEYIPNAKPITDYAWAGHLGIRKRLGLFTKVCDAVHHGHQKGIIHRDLKPGNILVDSNGEVKIIDFGVARSTDSDMAVTTLQTDIGQLIGTLQYMSPEQCDANPHDLDTRSDVYSLGVVLYELLCEQLPYDVAKSAIFEAARIICEQTPNRPSETNRLLGGDVQTIILKALEKDRRQRYGSAAELRDDITCYLQNLPIAARLPTIPYRLRLFVRRNRLGVMAAAVLLIVAVLVSVGGGLALVIALTLGLAGTGWQFFLAYRAKAEAVRQRDVAVAHRRIADSERIRSLEAEAAAQQQRNEADQARQAAELAEKEARAINEFLLLDMLAATDPAEARGRNITVREVLDNAADKIDKAFRDQPGIEAAVRRTISIAYRSLGRFTEAEFHLRIALDIHTDLHSRQHPKVADDLNSLGRLLYEMGDLEAAEPALREALAIRRTLLGNQHRHVAAVLGNLASLMRTKGDLDSARELCQEALTINRKAYGKEHPAVATCLEKIARLHEAQGDYDRAETYFRDAIEMQRKLLGEDHLHVGLSLNNLGTLLQRKHDYDAAEPVLQEALSIFQQRLGEKHQYVFAAMNNLANILKSREDYEAAAGVFRKVIRLVEDTPSQSALSVPMLCTTYGDCLVKAGQYEEAESQLHAAYESVQSSSTPDRDALGRITRKIADLYDAWGKPDKAAEWQAKLVNAEE